jgi:YegS/Rv2252/BmrU family lipid kinase
MDMRNIAVIYNPSAGTLLQNDGMDFESFLQSQVADYANIAVTPIQFNPDKLDAIKSRITSDEFNEVWAAGGDGTVISTAKMLKDTPKPLGVIPGGTMNLLARDLGMSLELDRAIHQLIEGLPDYIDVALLNDEPFFCIANIGLSTRLTEKRESLRQLPGWIRWPRVAIETVRSMFVYPPFRLMLRTQDSEIHTRTRALSISNNPLGDSMGLIPERFGLNDGLLGMYITKSRSLWTLPRLVLKFINGTWKDDPDLINIETDHATLTIRGKREMKVMIDGELHTMSPPFDIKIIPNRLHVIKPNTRTTEAAA